MQECRGKLVYSLYVSLDKILVVGFGRRHFMMVFVFAEVGAHLPVLEDCFGVRSEDFDVVSPLAEMVDGLLEGFNE